MKMNISWVIVIVLVVGIIGTMVWYGSKPGEYDTFAQCIKESGATFYGAFWCPHCQDQKKLFGKSAKELPYVECSTPNGQGQTQVCIDAKVASYPTWRFADGTEQTGVISLSDLASSTACTLAKDIN